MFFVNCNYLQKTVFDKHEYEFNFMRIGFRPSIGTDKAIFKTTNRVCCT